MKKILIAPSFLFLLIFGVSVKVYPCTPPQAPVNTTKSANLTICSGSSATLSANGTGNLGWYSAATGGTYLGKDTNYITPILIKTTTFYVQDSTCAASSSRTAVTVTVNESPWADFNNGPACNGYKMSFVFTGYRAASAANTSYNWNFNNEGNSTLENPSILLDTGNKKITLTVTTNNGCKDSITKTLNVRPQAKADFTVIVHCETEGVSFINQTQGTQTYIMTYIWKFGDGNMSTVESPTHKFHSNGVSMAYNVTLIARVTNGCTDTLTKLVTVNANPKSDFTYTVSGQSFAFRASQDGNIAYKWFLGTGDSLTSRYIVYQYPKHGLYNVCLIVTDSAGCFSKTCRLISTDPCANMELVIDSLKDISCLLNGFASAHSLNGKKPYTYEWNTTPPTKDSFANFKSRGIYSIVSKDSNGCERETSLLINGPLEPLGFELNNSLVGGPLRPGREDIVSLMGFNDGCVPVNGRLSVFPDSKVSYQRAFKSPDKIIGDTLIWNFSQMNLESEPLHSNIFFLVDNNVTINDTICFDVAITPVNGDINSYNNKKRYCYPVRNSYDPNIKLVYPPGDCEQGYVLKNRPLTYTVQFQNTGNDKAIDIYILDSLDSHFDLNSLRVIGFSHQAPVTEILPDRVIKFKMDNINLPDSFSDEKGSHGYVIYELMPNIGAINGTIIKSKAGIYFDFNPPVMTNELKNTFINSIPDCNISGINDPINEQFITLYPNPNSGTFTIKLKDQEKELSIEIYDLFGRKIKNVEMSPSKSDYLVDMNVANGIYLVKVKIDGLFYNERVSITR